MIVRHSKRGAVIRWMAVIVALAVIAATPALITSVRGQESNPAQTRNFRDQARYMISDLADQVVPSIVTIYVKQEPTQQQKEQFKQFQRFFDQRNMDPFFRQFFFDDGNDNDNDNDNKNNNQPQMPRFKLPGQQRSGSGVILSEDGLIITNAHVLGDPTDETDIRIVFSDGEEISGKDIKPVASQDFLDLSIVKVDAGKLKMKLKPLKWGDSDKLRIGEMVATIGSPLDLRMTVTQGIVCAKFRSIDGANGPGDMIQTDAVINPGSSGGALVNMDGELIGINRLITTNTGMWSGYGFAIPSNDAREFADKVLKTGKAVYGYIGVGMKVEVTDDDLKTIGVAPDTKGVLVMNVPAGGPAAKAGIIPYDFITEVDGKAFEQNSQTDINNELLRTVMSHNPGDKLKLTVQRGGGRGKTKTMNFTLTIGERPTQAELDNGKARPRTGPTPQPTPDKSREILGLIVEPYNKGDLKGMRVTGIKPDSAAADRGIRVGDVITDVNREPVASFDDMNNAVKDRPKDMPHLLQLVRAGTTYPVVVPQQ